MECVTSAEVNAVLFTVVTRFLGACVTSANVSIKSKIISEDEGHFRLCSFLFCYGGYVHLTARVVTVVFHCYNPSCMS